MFINMGYRVILITTEIVPEKEYPLPSSVIRVMIPRCCSTQRAQQLRDALFKYNVSLFIHHAATNPNLLFDILVVKTAGIPMVVVQHGLSSYKKWAIGGRPL